jgi:pimeloyl-ACP methyl ester carboxylesterase
MDDFKTVELRGVKIAYREHGKGRPVLMLHGVASFSYTWKYLIDKMPGDFRFIMLDFKSLGYSEKIADNKLSPFDQSQIVIDFIKYFKLENILLIGHALGGAVSLLTIFDSEVSKRVTDLVILDCFGMFLKVPDFVADFLDSAEDKLMLKYTDTKPDVLPRFILNEFYYDSDKISSETIEEYAKVYSFPDAKKCMISVLRQMMIANFADFYSRLDNLKIRTLIIWGEEDTIIDIEDAFYFKNAIPGSILKIIPLCGHSPQEECPVETAELIQEFLNGEPLKHIEEIKDEAKQEKATPPPAPALPIAQERHLKMRRLFSGHWSFIAVVFFIVIKFLQFYRRLGIFAKENGWRKITQIFLRKEHSKFCLTSFRLNYLNEDEKSDIDYQRAKILLVAKLFKFIKNNPVFHWSLETNSFSVEKKHNEYVDIVIAEFDECGKMLTLDPRFETKKEEGLFLSASKSEQLCEMIVKAYNATVDIKDEQRPKKLSNNITKWLLKTFDKVSDQITIRHYGRRIFQGTFIHFERTTEVNENSLSRERLASPDFSQLKHPGAGLLNIYCRLSPDMLEADLWFQYHHVPVDGMPMQEMLEKLKEQWGAVGPVVYPSLQSSDAAPEVKPAGDNMYRGRVFCDFSKILKVRKQLNHNHYNDMGGAAPLPALLMWGIAEHADFKGYKFSMPVDTALLDAKGNVNERNISLIFIQPEMFYDKNEPFDGLLNFIREFNYLIHMTRLGKSESYEFIDLAGLLHPCLTSLLHKMISKTFSEVIGNAGLTIIKNAEMFITPLTELQSSGFIAIGNCRMPTADGKYAGAVSVCGEKKLVDSYVAALKDVTDNFDNYVQST